MLTDYQKPIDVKFFLLFIPVAYFSYLFHEFGHWSVGEILGNRMVYSLNSVWPKDGHYLQQSHDVYVSIGGPGFSVFEPNDNYVRVYAPRKAFGPAEWRRMIYATVIRQRPDGVFGAFDCPDGGQIAPKRTRSTTPLQALNLLNSEFVMQQAAFLAERLEREAGSDTAAQVQRAFSLAFNRTPEPEELAAATQLIREHGLRAFCRALFNANEFVYVF